MDVEAMNEMDLLAEKVTSLLNDGQVCMYPL